MVLKIPNETFLRITRYLSGKKEHNYTVTHTDTQRCSQNDQDSRAEMSENHAHIHTHTHTHTRTRTHTHTHKPLKKRSYFSEFRLSLRWIFPLPSIHRRCLWTRGSRFRSDFPFVRRRLPWKPSSFPSLSTFLSLNASRSPFTFFNALCALCWHGLGTVSRRN